MKTKILFLLLFVFSLSALGQKHGKVPRRKAKTERTKSGEQKRPKEEKTKRVEVESGTDSLTGGNTHRGHEWVDLGLPSGTKWATTNVGASSPTEFGLYFAWGETSQKDSYEWNNLKYCIDDKGYGFTKYVTDRQYGDVDDRKELEPSDDAACANWGEGWRMPSAEQITELLQKCKWDWVSEEDYSGFKVVGENGNFIFLPAAGCRQYSTSTLEGKNGFYWSRTLLPRTSNEALFLHFFSRSCDLYNDSRRSGFNVRAVLDVK